MTSSTFCQSSSMFPCQPQMHQKPIKLHRLLSRKVGCFCSRTVILVVCLGLKSKSEPMCNTCHLGLACRSVEAGTRAVEGSSLPVWKSVWWSPPWGLSLPQPVGQSNLPAGEGSWGTPALIHSSMNTFQYSSSTVPVHYLGMQITYDLVIYILNIKMGIHDWYINNTGSIFL